VADLGATGTVPAIVGLFTPGVDGSRFLAQAPDRCVDIVGAAVSMLAAIHGTAMPPSIIDGTPFEPPSRVACLRLARSVATNLHRALAPSDPRLRRFGDDVSRVGRLASCRLSCAGAVTIHGDAHGGNFIFDPDGELVRVIGVRPTRGCAEVDLASLWCWHAECCASPSSCRAEGLFGAVEARHLAYHVCLQALRRLAYHYGPRRRSSWVEPVGARSALGQLDVLHQALVSLGLPT
jgi:hypothetical protein